MPTVSGDVNVNIDLEVEVYCGRCGAGLCNQSEAGNTRQRHTPFISVEPCKKCLSDEKDAGYQEGYDAREREISHT